MNVIDELEVKKTYELEKELQATKEQLEKAEKVIEFYADKNKWELGKVHSFVEVCEQDQEWIDPCPPFRVTQLTGGKRARQYFQEKQKDEVK